MYEFSFSSSSVDGSKVLVWKLILKDCAKRQRRRGKNIFQYLLQTLSNQFILFLYMFEMKIHKLLDEKKDENHFPISGFRNDVFFNFIAFSTSNDVDSLVFFRKKLS